MLVIQMKLMKKTAFLILMLSVILFAGFASAQDAVAIADPTSSLSFKSTDTFSIKVTALGKSASGASGTVDLSIINADSRADTGLSASTPYSVSGFGKAEVTLSVALNGLAPGRYTALLEASAVGDNFFGNNRVTKNFIVEQDTAIAVPDNSLLLVPLIALIALILARN